ncbi:MAG: hypothetical protein IKE65_04710 [Clostridia bacterium]|nr:hypothetical protein [Clostridia bacterium]
MAKIRYSSKEKVIEESDSFIKFVSENDLIVEDKIILLTKENAKIVEKLIRNDDDYFPFSQKIFDYYGLDQVKNNSNKALFAVIREIDRDNSTNVWRYKTNRDSFYKMVSYITAPENDFFVKLEKGETELPDSINQCGSGLKSLSSKVCKYLCDFAFKKDNYYINDSIVRRMLLFYLDYYNIEHSELKSSCQVDQLDYKTLHNWLLQLHSARNTKYNDEITKSELDHILWYCYKSFDL